MSTRAYIITTNKTKTVYTYNYIHYDGYIYRGIGEDLLFAYNHPILASKLTSIGDRSSIDSEEPYKDSRTTIHHSKSLELILKDGAKWGFGIEYFYFFDPETSSWEVACSETDFIFVDLETFYTTHLRAEFARLKEWNKKRF